MIARKVFGSDRDKRTVDRTSSVNGVVVAAAVAAAVVVPSPSSPLA